LTPQPLMPVSDSSDDFMDAGGTFIMSPLDVLGLRVASGQPSQHPPMEWSCHGLPGIDLHSVEDLLRFVRAVAVRYVSDQVEEFDVKHVLDEIWMDVASAVKEGAIRELNDLTAYVMAVTSRIVSNHNGRGKVQIEGGSADVGARRKQRPVHRTSRELMARLLREMRPFDREVLERFYVQCHSADRICAEMRLTARQFRLLRERVKVRLAEMGREQSRLSVLLNSSGHIGSAVHAPGPKNGSRWR
jgi:hypothetical protein